MKYRNLLTYFNERFPPAGVAFISLTVALYATGLIDGQISQSQLIPMAAVAVAFAAFLLRQRVVDEFKDKAHDDTNFPDRPYQRGLIDDRSLILLGVMALCVELAAVYAVGGIISLLWYAPVLLYSVLMWKEFLARRWLEQRFTTYFLLHEIVFVLYGIWIYKSFGLELNNEVLAWIISFTAAMMAIEIGRKYSLRLDPRGAVVKDTYVAVWGRQATITAASLLLLAAGIGLAYAEHTLWLAALPAIAVPALKIMRDRDTLIKLLIISVVVGLVAGGAAV